MIMLSPGVYTQEEDFSLYAQNLATSIFGIVTTASKGPLNQIVLCTDESQLVAIFGPPAYPHYGLYAGIEYLRKGRQLKVVRVATYEKTATCPKFDDSGGGSTAFQALALSPGSWSNKITVTVSAGFISGTYKITVAYDGTAREVYDRVRIGSAYEDHPDYIETRINGISQYISVVAYDVSTIQCETHAFSEGDDGAPADASDVIGVPGQPPVVPTTGLQLFADPETVDINIIAAPGFTQDAVNRALIQIAETRRDCLALIDSPDMLTLMQIVDWHNGQLSGDPSYPAAAYNTSYGTLFYPWLRVYDNYNNQNVWLPPSGHIAQLLANCDEVADPWWSPVGPNRGILIDAQNVRTTLRRGEMDYMYATPNAVNMIINKAGMGVVAWSQKTLQRKPTALDHINVRRLMCTVEKIVATTVEYLLQEPNDRWTWERFVNYVEPVMEAIKARRGVYDYRVICDETTNTPLAIDRNELHGRVMLKPTKSIDYVSVTWTILGGAVSFEEILGS